MHVFATCASLTLDFCSPHHHWPKQLNIQRLRFPSRLMPLWNQSQPGSSWKPPAKQLSPMLGSSLCCFPLWFISPSSWLRRLLSRRVRFYFLFLTYFQAYRGVFGGSKCISEALLNIIPSLSLLVTCLPYAELPPFWPSTVIACLLCVSSRSTKLQNKFILAGCP